MRKITKAGLSLLGVAAMLAGVTGPALADTSAYPPDFVAVGSDTVQNAANFIFDGDQNLDLGFNFYNKATRVFTFDANGDDNGRAVYPLGASTVGTGNLPVTEILRVGTLPVPRPNGSGAGISALTVDTVGSTGYINAGYPTLPNGSINIVRASRLPTAAENTKCVALAKCGGLHVFQFAWDYLNAATAITTNAPANLTNVQLAHIFQCDAGYQHWNDSGIGGTSTDAIIPVIPQSGSGTRAFFLADMATALGVSSITLGSCVVTGQEHDPSSIYSNTLKQDVIMPFSTAKITLINSGYFGSAEQNQIKSNLTTGSLTGYNTARGLYFVVREYDLANALPYSPSATKNIYQYLFQASTGFTPFVAQSSNAPLIQSAGLITTPVNGLPAYADLGQATSG